MSFFKNKAKFIKKTIPINKEFPKNDHYTKHKPRNFWFYFKKIILLLLILIIIGIITGISWFYSTIIKNLPDISQIENINFAQTTIITDRNGEILYKLFDQNREYVSYNQISPWIIKSIIATEDKNFWTNPGIDIWGLARAAYYDVTNPGASKQGGSTLTQQLIKNLLLTSEKKITRKLKEIVLALELNNHIKTELLNKYNNISGVDLDNKVKEKILELYLNYVPFSNNAYGVEIASQIYFGTSAQNLNLLQSAILAGIPQAPSKYNPYSNKENLMGKLIILGSNNQTGNISNITGEFKQLITSKLSKTITGATFNIAKDTESYLTYIKSLINFDVDYKGIKYHITYQNGKKDIVLGRLWEEKYITKEELKKNFLDSFSIKFKQQIIEIKAPHFVFYVIDLLKTKYGISEEILEKGGLQITTSLDLNMQNIAQTLVKENMDYLKSKGANNTAFVYVDSLNGDILTYIGSADYNNEQIDGQVDILQSPRQPGSTIKPLLYSLGFIKNKFTLDTVVYDLPITIGKNTPQNVDGSFLGMMPLRKALAYSRNIPAIKMYFAVGEDLPVKNFLKSLGINTLHNDIYYGYPLGIGGAEVKLFELANAYTHLSALGNPAVLNPIVEIRSADGSIIYKKKIEHQKNIIPSGVAYLLWKILSETENMPPNWVSNFILPGITFATKSGTTNLVDKNGKKYPRDGWLVTYTPSKVAIFWAGNTKGEHLHIDAFGGWLNAKIWKNFFIELKNRHYIDQEEMEPSEIKTVSISKISGKLANNDTPLKFIDNTIGYINNLPSDEDDTITPIKIDSMCNGLVGDLTPPGGVVDGYIIKPSSIIENGRDLEDINKWWKVYGLAKFSGLIGKPIFLEAPTNTCVERESVAKLGTIKIQISQPQAQKNIYRKFAIIYKIKSPFNIAKINFFLDETKIGEFIYNKTKSEIIDLKEITIPSYLQAGNYTLKGVASDDKGYTDTIQFGVNVVAQDTNPPILLQDQIKINNTNGKKNISLIFQDPESIVQGGKIFQNNIMIKTFQGNIASVELDNLDNVTYEVADINNNIAQGNINFR